MGTLIQALVIFRSFCFVFQEKVICSLNFDFSGCDFRFLFKFTSFPLLKQRKANYNFEQQKFKCHKKLDRLLVSEFNVQISQRNKFYLLFKFFQMYFS